MSNGNPVDILGVHPSGALLRPIDDRDYRTDMTEVGMAPAPFDWDKGWDIEEEIGGKLPTKDQGTSGSCGGQTVGEYGQAIAWAVLQDMAERSAKAPYSQVFVTGGGSTSRMLGDIIVKQGLYREALVPSYENGKPPSEAFMERPWDITQAARDDARKGIVGNLAYVFTKLDIDSIAAAARDNHGSLLGIHGSNNGTWLSSYPSPKQVGDLWAHFMYVGKARRENGKKGLWCKQSWGKDVAPDTDAWQFITEDHFVAGRIWDSMIFVWSEIPTENDHVFLKDILYGQTSAEVVALQAVLARIGCFTLAPTGYYGDITAASVIKFRAKYGVDGSTDPKGRSVGPRTRAALNAL